jgi:hypothetical protein
LKPKNIWTQVVNQSQLMLVKGESKSLKKSKHLTLAFAEKKSIAQILVPETFTVSVVGSACFAGVNLLLIGAKIGLRIIFWVLRLVCQPHDFCVTKPWFGECLCSRGNMLTFPPTMPRNLPRIQVTSQVAKPHYPASWEDAVSFQIISKVNTETPQICQGYCPLSENGTFLVKILTGECEFVTPKPNKWPITKLSTHHDPSQAHGSHPHPVDTAR